MTCAFRLAAVLVSLSLAPAVESDAAPVTATIHTENVVVRPALELRGLTTVQTTMIHHAVELLDTAGLDLPPLVVAGGERGVDCGGHDGLHHPHDGWSEIELCATAQTAAVMHTVLHEMAHAWTAHSLRMERQQAFMTLRDVDVWQDYDVAAWEDNGIEQAAEIIAWGVNDVAASTVRIDQVSCAQLVAGYETLTGMTPSFGLTDICAGGLAVSKA